MTAAGGNTRPGSTTSYQLYAHVLLRWGKKRVMMTVTRPWAEYWDLKPIIKNRKIVGYWTNDAANKWFASSK